MSWIVVGTMAAGTVMNSAEASRKRKQEQKMNEAAAVQTAYSPWTGMGNGEISNNAPGALGAALQGGIQGASMGANLQGAFKSQPKPIADFDNAKMDAGIDPNLVQKKQSPYSFIA